MFFFQNFMFSSVSCYFQHLKKKFGVKKNSGGGGGGKKKKFVFRRIILQNFMFSSRFMLFPMVKWEVVSPNSRYRGQWESIYPI